MSVQPETAQALVDTIFMFGRSLRAAVTTGADSLLPPALNELAVDLCVSQSSLSRQMSDLVDAGYVERNPDPADKRAFRIRVSEEGHDVLRRTTQRRAARLRNMLEDWSQEEAMAAVTSLQRLNETFGASNRQASPAVPHTGVERETRASTGGDGSAREAGAMTHREILEALTGLIAALFTALLSSTIVSTALPTIIGELHGTQTQYAWIITTALLATAASTPIWGKLADLYNKKVLVQTAIVIFVIGSVIAGAAHNVPLLLGARVIQGIGMGGLTALVVAIIGTIIPPRDRGRYSGYMGAAMAVSMSGGPILGGVLVDTAGWRWCFYVCVPLAVIALFLLQRTLHVETVKKDNVSIDWMGATLLTAGVSVLLIWVSFAGQDDYYAWFSKESAFFVIGGLALLGLTMFVESKVKDPILPIKIITERTTALAIIASIAVGVGLFGATTFLTQYFQT
eukprot:gene21526-25852_t